jgi:hypothetical protein
MELPVESYGPQLHFLGRKGDRWRVRVVVGWRPEKKDPQATTAEPAPNFKSDAWKPVLESGRQLHCKVGPHVEFVLYALDGEVTLSDQAQKVTCDVEFAGQQRHSEFVVPAKSDDATLGYCSCNDVQRKDGRVPDVYRSWAALLKEHAQSPYHVMIAGGDQIYGDAAREINETMDYKAKLEEFYLREYLGRFAKEQNMAHALSTIPFVMQPDDHDYYNGAGSMGAQEPLLVRCVAHKYRFLFQLGRAAEEAEDREGLVESSAVVVTGPNVVVLNLDMRSARNTQDTQQPLMRKATFDRLVRELEEVLPDVKPKHLIVLQAVPPVFVQNNTLTSIYEIFDMPDTSDLIDSALSRCNIGQTQVILTTLFDLAKKFLVRLTFISGDAHVSGTGSMRSKTHNGTFHHDFRGAQLWISSPMCNEPEAKLVTLVNMAKTVGIIPRELGELVMTLDEFHAERNWMRISVHSSAKALIGVFIHDTDGNANFVRSKPLTVVPLVAAPQQPPPGAARTADCCMM